MSYNANMKIKQNTIFIASSNKDKIREFAEILGEQGYTVKSLIDYPDYIQPDETGKTFEENAVIKAEHFSNAFRCACIADDSGLEIEALNNEPGIYSARYLGRNTPYKEKNAIILSRMESADNRKCRYVCAVALCIPNEKTHVFTGICEGLIAEKPAGSNGFGYDPIFYYPKLNKTLAEMSEEEKNQISHRGIAIQKMKEYMK